MNNKVSLVSWIALCLAAGGLGSVATSAKIPTWYATLVKPTWNPPNWIFAPVWTTLYILMAVAVWMVWSRRKELDVRVALGLFCTQLALNTLWSFLFFRWKNPAAAMVEIVALWASIAATMIAFRPASLTAVWLLAPYLAWVSFAACLNFAIWQLNS